MAEDFEENESYEKAADFYYRSYQVKANNAKTIQGLERTSPKLLEAKLKDFSKNYNAEQYELAIDLFEEARDYQLKLNRVGMDLSISKFYTDKYEDTKDILAEEYYKAYNESYRKEEYKKALDQLNKSIAYRPDYKDSQQRLLKLKEILKVEKAESLYQSASEKYNQKDYRGAYLGFMEVSKNKANYKNTESLKSQALKKGMIRIGIFEFKNDTSAKGAGGALYSYVTTNIVNHGSPFVQLIERDNLDKLLKEQKLGMSGIVDQSTASSAGKLIGLDYVMLGRMVSVTQSDGQIRARSVPCYEMYSVRNNNGEIEQRGRNTSFTLYEGTNRVVLEAKYQLVNVETGEIVLDELLSSSASDNVRYATYYGDYTRLSMTNSGGSVFGQIFPQRVDQSLFVANRNLKSLEEMQAPILRKLSEDLVNHMFSKLQL